MGLFKIVTPTQVQAKMALPAIEAALPVIDAAIDTAQLRMEAELGTRFDTGTLAEAFNCDPSVHNLVPDGYFRLRLSRGFVVPNTVVVTVGGEDITAQCTVKASRGYVFVPEQIATNKVVNVGYTYGFNTGVTPPDWLVEATLSYVPAAFYMGNPDVRNDSSSAQVCASAISHALAVISPHTRKLNFAIDPIFPPED